MQHPQKEKQNYKNELFVITLILFGIEVFKQFLVFLFNLSERKIWIKLKIKV